LVEAPYDRATGCYQEFEIVFEHTAKYTESWNIPSIYPQGGQVGAPNLEVLPRLPGVDKTTILADVSFGFCSPGRGFSKNTIRDRIQWVVEAAKQMTPNARFKVRQFVEDGSRLVDQAGVILGPGRRCVGVRKHRDWVCCCWAIRLAQYWIHSIKSWTMLPFYV
jgi:hypothetical protein